MIYLSKYTSPVGKITLAAEDGALRGAWFENSKHYLYSLDGERTAGECEVFDEAKEWLDIYFGGGIPCFTPKLKFSATDFQALIWRLLLEIPYGETVTYGELARRAAEEMNIPRMSAQAVGGAVGRNPVGIIVPCHRVIGADGSLTGYAAGTEKKEFLLRHEGALK